MVTMETFVIRSAKSIVRTTSAILMGHVLAAEKDIMEKPARRFVLVTVIMVSVTCHQGSVTGARLVTTGTDATRDVTNSA